MTAGRPLLIVAGEASGDLHAARLLSRLAELAPEVEPFGMGGDEMVAAGLDRVADSSEISVVGLTEALKIVPRAREIFALLLEEVERRRQPGEEMVAVLVDFPDFNLRLAKALKKRGLTVVYYISPQVWAWRRGRVRTIARCVDRMLVLFPFEVDFYAEHGVEVTHVGHPLVDEVPELPQVWDGVGEGEAVAPYRLALLPGSRKSEIEALLPSMLESARRLARRLSGRLADGSPDSEPGAGPPLAVRLIRAPTIPREMLQEAVAASGLAEAGVEVEIHGEDRFRTIADCHLALCASGTATLEVALLGTPMLVVYKLNRWTYLAARWLVRLPHISLVNLVLERGAVPELVQSDADPANVAREAAELLADRPRLAAMRAALGEVRQRLGEGGGSAKAARQVLALLADRGGSGGDGTGSDSGTNSGTDSGTDSGTGNSAGTGPGDSADHPSTATSAAEASP